MTPPNDVILVGVDAGGSKTTAWASTRSVEYLDAVADLRPDGIGQAGPGNARAVGLAEATAAIATAIESAIRQAAPVASQDDATPSPLKSWPMKLCVGAAGAGRDEEQRALTAALQQRFPHATIRVTHDAEPVLAAASPQGVGIALISGTGSLAWGRAADGRVQRSGGWGYLIDDAGSGYWIAMAAIAAACREADGRGRPTQITDRMLRWFDVGSVSGMIEVIYRQPVPRRWIAQFCQTVFDLADSDPVASSILQQAAEQLSALVTSLAGRLELERDRVDGPIALGLAGGVLVNHRSLRQQTIERIPLRFSEVTVVAEPVAGALRIAAKL